MPFPEPNARLLNEQEYKATLSPPMREVTGSADEIVDLWGYADPIIETEFQSYAAWEWRVAYIYESAAGQYQHIGIPVPLNNTYLVIVVDVPNERIAGHHYLDLGAFYGVKQSAGDP